MYLLCVVRLWYERASCLCVCWQLGRQWCERGRQRQSYWCRSCQNQPQVLSTDRSCTSPSHFHLHIRHHHFNTTVFSPFVFIIIINKVLIKVMLNKVIAGALYIVCGWNTVKVQSWQYSTGLFSVCTVSGHEFHPVLFASVTDCECESCRGMYDVRWFVDVEWKDIDWLSDMLLTSDVATYTVQKVWKLVKIWQSYRECEKMTKLTK